MFINVLHPIVSKNKLKVKFELTPSADIKLMGYLRNKCFRIFLFLIIKS